MNTVLALDGDQPDAASGGGEPVVRCDRVARTYGSGPAAVVAVHDTSCEVPPGARIALTGPSGSGKSTLLHLMAGLDRPTAGTVSWPGLDAPALGSRIGVVFQSPSLIPDLDATENVALPLLLSGTPQAQADRLARAALAAVGLEAYASALPEEMSGGQAQRVAVARVLATRPVLLLADEPTGQLDRATADRLVTVLLQVTARLGAALVVATHDPAVSGRLDQQWAMSGGTLRLDLPGRRRPAQDTDRPRSGEGTTAAEPGSDENRWQR